MASAIVKIKSFYDDALCYFGTGFVIGDNLILTAAHVLRGDRYIIEDDDGNIIGALVEPIPDNSIVGILRTVSEMHITPIKLTQNFIVSPDDNWEFTGFITSHQTSHYVAGKGLNPIKAGNPISDYCLSDIRVGRVGNYRGLSGTPVFVDGMVIGIAQEQVGFSDMSSDILISSTTLFSPLLSDYDIFQKNEVLHRFEMALTKMSDAKIEQNIYSAKYIPDIFVEDNNTKDCIRYFADSGLFKKKIIEEYNSIDFEPINLFARKYLDRSIESIPENSIDTPLLLEELLKCKSILDDLNATFYKEGIDDPYLYQTCVNISLKFKIENMIRLVEFTSYQAILLLQKAGQGKTNFVCDFTYNFLKKKNYIYLYINAYEININPKDYIIEKLLNASGKQLDNTLLLLQLNYLLTNRPMLIIIDGLNENTTISNFALEMCSFLEYLIDKPYIRVLVTSRSEFFNERFSPLTQRLPTGLLCVQDINRYYPSKIFKERLFWGYIDFFEITIQPGALYISTFDQLSENPLLLRFFCEVNKGKKSIHIYHIYQYSLFQKYLENKLEEYRSKYLDIVDFRGVYYSLFDKMVNYMIESDVYHNIPITIFSEKEQMLVSDLLLNDILLKDEQEITQGILDVKTILISFTYDEFRDYYITTYIAKTYSDNQINNFICKLSGKTIEEGVQKYLFFIAKMTRNENVTLALKAHTDFDQLYWNNIYNVEEIHLTEEDIQNIYNRCFSKHYVQAVNYLMGRFDTTYFVKINIDLLYKVFDKYCEITKSYFTLIRDLFQIQYTEEPYYYFRDSESKAKLLAYNKLLDMLHDILSLDTIDIRFEKFIVLTFYLYKLEEYDTNTLWIEFYLKYPSACHKILSQYNNNVHVEINKNIKRILKSILDQSESRPSESIVLLYQSNISNVDVPRENFLQSLISGLLDNLEEGDEN